MNSIAELDKYGLTFREKVAYIGTRLKSEPQADITLKHIFEPGVYVREMVIPPETCFIGRPHRFGHRLHFVSGSFRMLDPAGESFSDSPHEIFTKPEHVTVLVTLQYPLVLRTYHENPVECRDIELMERLIFHTEDEVRQVADRVEHRILELT
jgi:hypothetical protein